MQQFIVPQFIEVEDKIFGPITMRQFLILLGTGLALVGVYRLADIQLFILIAVISLGLAALFAFARPNGQVFHFFVLNVLTTMKRPSLRVWSKSFTKKELNMLRNMDMSEEVTEEVQKKTVRKKHIRDLSLVVNTGGYYRPETFLE